MHMIPEYLSLGLYSFISLSIVSVLVSNLSQSLVPGYYSDSTEPYRELGPQPALK